MVDAPAVRAYRGEIERLRTQVARAADTVERHLADVRHGLNDPRGAGLQVQNLGAATAELIDRAAALKALLEVDYLVDGA